MTKILQGVALLIGAILLLLILLVAAFLIYRAFRQSELRQKTALKGANSIEELKSVEIGAMEQWIYIRGEDRANPVLLFLQDGLLPMIYRARQLGYLTGLEKDFTIVYWDKRGEGKSYRSREQAGSFDTEDYVEDTYELTLYLKSYLKQEKIYLAGHSGGSEIGIFTVAKYPDEYAAYIGIGQVINYLQCSRYSYEWLKGKLKERGDEESYQRIAAMGAPPYSSFEDELTFYSKKVEVGGMHFSLDYAGTDNKRLMENLLYSPEYSLGEVLAFLKEPIWLAKYRAEKNAFYSKDLKTMIDELKLPVYFVQGRHDQGTTLYSLEPFFEQLKAPAGKKLLIFEKSAHYPCYEEPEEFRRVLTGELLGE